MVRIGTAGWVIPRQSAAMATGEGSHLERYARVFNCVEINSSFYRAHRLATWARWAEAAPEDFRFSVKFPKTVTHKAKLAAPAEAQEHFRNLRRATSASKGGFFLRKKPLEYGVSAESYSENAMDGFFAETAGLGKKLGVVLVQLPPSLGFEDCPAAEFFEALRDRWQGAVALEPRHASWFGEDAEELMQRHRVGRVAADPVRKGAVALQAGGWDGLAYFRLHGSPRMYYSEYSREFLERVARAVRELPEGTETWVVFDNTAAGAAFGNAVELMGMIMPH